MITVRSIDHNEFPRVDVQRRARRSSRPAGHSLERRLRVISPCSFDQLNAN